MGIVLGSEVPWVEGILLSKGWSSFKSHCPATLYCHDASLISISHASKWWNDCRQTQQTVFTFWKVQMCLHHRAFFGSTAHNLQINFAATWKLIHFLALFHTNSSEFKVRDMLWFFPPQKWISWLSSQTLRGKSAMRFLEHTSSPFSTFSLQSRLKSSKVCGISDCNPSPPFHAFVALICIIFMHVKHFLSLFFFHQNLAIFLTRCPHILGAKKLTTVEYNSIISSHPDHNALTPRELATHWLSGSLPEYDFAISYSSYEHDGLGRYGDPIDPWGDIWDVRRISCFVKPEGYLFLGVPMGPDQVQLS